MSSVICRERFNVNKSKYLLQQSEYEIIFSVKTVFYLFPNSHKGPENWWSNNATIEDWFDEFVGQANIINRFAGVRMEDLWGEFL